MTDANDFLPHLFHKAVVEHDGRIHLLGSGPINILARRVVS